MNGNGTSFRTTLFSLWVTVCLSVLGIGGCETQYKIELLAYNPETDMMEFQVKTITTLDDLGRMEGRATRMRGGLDLIKNEYHPTEHNDGGKVIWRKNDKSVAFNSTKRHGVHYPTDFNSFAMASIYYNLEQAMLYFESCKMALNLLKSPDTYFLAEVEEISPDSPDGRRMTNNAFYWSISNTKRGFYILPYEMEETKTDYPLNGLPLSFNSGIIAHEYTHGVVQVIVRDKMIFFENLKSLSMENVNAKDLLAYHLCLSEMYLFGLDEGVADLFAVALTGDPDFIEKSLDYDVYVRNAAENIVYSSSYDTPLENDARTCIGMSLQESSPDNRNPYVLGAFFSAAFFEIARRIQGFPADGDDVPDDAIRRIVATAAYQALLRLGNLHQNDTIEKFNQELGDPSQYEVPDDPADTLFFKPAHFFSLFLSQLDKGYQEKACDVIRERFSLHFNEVQGCL